MKIGSATNIDNVHYLSQVREKRDGEKGGQHSGQNPYQQQKKREEEPEKFEVTQAAVDQAVESFKSDSQAQGLVADVSGKGPGLRVVLKDGNGAVVRQFTGEEFLQMREAAKDGRTSGKILDRKL